MGQLRINRVKGLADRDPTSIMILWPQKWNKATSRYHNVDFDTLIFNRKIFNHAIYHFCHRWLQHIYLGQAFPLKLKILWIFTLFVEVGIKYGYHVCQKWFFLIRNIFQGRAGAWQLLLKKHSLITKLKLLLVWLVIRSD